MKNLFEHIEHVKGKPHHIRKRVAFGAAGGISALIGLIWLGSSLATGAFMIQGSDFAQSTEGGNTLTVTPAATPNQGLAGAAAAISAAKQPAHIEIIDAASSTPKQKTEQTVIPF